MAETWGDGPLGIRLSGILLFIIGIVSAYYFIGVLLQPSDPNFSGIIKYGYTLGLLITAIGSLIGSYGLYRMKKWGWLIALNIYGLALGLDLAVYFVSPRDVPFLRIVLTAIILGYIYRSKNHFE